MTHELINPPTLAKPSGYTHGIATRGGTLLFLSGQTGIDVNGRIAHPDDMVKQFEQALLNLREVVQAAGGAMTDIVKLTLFVADKAEYLEQRKAIGAVYRAILGKHYPAMTLVEVASLLDDEALIEVEGMAVIGEKRD